MLIDSHCHLDSHGIDPDTPAVLARAASVGVAGCVTIATRLSDSPGVLALAERFETVWASVGSHPEYAAEEPLDSPAALVALCAHPKAVGIGETGLDYFYPGASRAQQLRNFRVHIAAARTTGLPLIVHTRDADADTLAILRAEMAAGPFCGVLHCFSGGRALAEGALDLGFYLSVSGIATFKNAEALRAILADVPLDRLLVETDAPYLAPVPHRGNPNEPSFVVATAAKLADIKRMNPADLAAATTANFFRLFAKAVPKP